MHEVTEETTLVVDAPLSSADLSSMVDVWEKCTDKEIKTSLKKVILAELNVISVIQKINLIEFKKASIRSVK